jgi:hypothetical protein
MTRQDYVAGRARAQAHLDRAREILSPGLATTDSMAAYYDAIDQDDMRAALKILESVGHTTTMPLEFWDALADAATDLGLHDSGEQFLNPPPG